MKQSTRIQTSVLIALSVVAFASAAHAQEDVTYTWSAPTTGSPVHHYVVQHQEDGGAWVTVASDVTTTQYVLTAAYEVQHAVRVAAVDGQGRQGPWSVGSEPYTPSLGAPGQPGQPIAVF